LLGLEKTLRIFGRSCVVVFVSFVVRGGVRTQGGGFHKPGSREVTKHGDRLGLEEISYLRALRVVVSSCASWCVGRADPGRRISQTRRSRSHEAWWLLGVWKDTSYLRVFVCRRLRVRRGAWGGCERVKQTGQSRSHEAWRLLGVRKDLRIFAPSCVVVFVCFVVREGVRTRGDRFHKPGRSRSHEAWWLVGGSKGLRIFAPSCVSSSCASWCVRACGHGATGFTNRAGREVTKHGDWLGLEKVFVSSRLRVSSSSRPSWCGVGQGCCGTARLEV